MEQHPWKVHVGLLLGEILVNPECAALTTPINILARILAEVGERAAELNDPKMNALMARLAVYSIGDPHSPEYDPKAVQRLIEEAALA